MIEGPSFEVQEGEGRARAREGVRVEKRGEGVGGEKIGEARQREDEDARGGEGRAREEGSDGHQRQWPTDDDGKTTRRQQNKKETTIKQ